MDTLTAHAPGRVELLGNHTDYNEGFVLSAAIDMGITVRGRALPDGKIALLSSAMEGVVETNVAQISRCAEFPWADYPLGVAWSFLEEGFPVGGFEAEISGDLPAGAGLSSSAALEVATALLLKKLFRFDIAPLRLAKLCRRAENGFAGVNCGLLDQVSSVFGKRGCVIFLDCRDETVETLPLPSGVELLITHTGVQHALTGGEYNERRAQCFEAAEKLGVRALRDVSAARLDCARESLPPRVWRRAAHVVGENERVLRGVALLKGGDVEGFGRLMFQSHESSRVNFENSAPELDLLVAIAREEPGVSGSRLTGGGFGGATVSLVEEGAAARIAENLARKYREQTGNVCRTWICKAADGAL